MTEQDWTEITVTERKTYRFPTDSIPDHLETKPEKERWFESQAEIEHGDAELLHGSLVTFRMEDKGNETDAEGDSQ